MIPFANPIDYWVSQTLNNLAQHSSRLDRVLEFIAVTHPVKGGIMMLAVWWLWFHKHEKLDERRAVLICLLLGATLSVALTKVVTFATPFRPRPLYNPELHLQMVSGVDLAYLEKLSSFPSDHASLFIALSFGFFYVSRRLGWATLAYAVLLICLPRAFLGFHYLSDIGAGAAIGITCAFLAQQTFIRSRVKTASRSWLQFHPASFYCCLFLVTYQIVNQFDEARSAAHMLVALVRGTSLT